MTRYMIVLWISIALLRSSTPSPDEQDLSSLALAICQRYFCQLFRARAGDAGLGPRRHGAAAALI